MEPQQTWQVKGSRQIWKTLLINLNHGCEPSNATTQMETPA
jgi:hypothetical protein